MNARRKRNMILKLQTKDGTMVDTEDEIFKRNCGLFEKLYTKEKRDRFCFLNLYSGDINNEKAIYLERKFEIEEIWATI